MEGMMQTRGAVKTETQLQVKLCRSLAVSPGDVPQLSGPQFPD